MPLLSYYGAKNRIAGKYPAPIHEVIIEPFAGSAGYSLKHHQKKVILIEKDDRMFGALDFLIRSSHEDILALPLIEHHQTVDDFNICQEAKSVIGFWLNKGCSVPAKRLSKWARETGNCNTFWSEKCRARLADTVQKIKHWKIIHGSYEDAPDIEATWFIDPPYQKAGKHYRCSSADLNFTKIGDWCKTRRGQVMVCENIGADWLPFREFCSFSGASKDGATRRRSVEAIWTND